MGSLSRRISRQGFRDSAKADRHRQRQDKHLGILMDRWSILTLPFHDCRFYVGGILKSEAEAVSREGVKILYAIGDKTASKPGWTEIICLPEPLTDSLGNQSAFALNVGNSQLVPVKLNFGFRIVDCRTPMAATPEKCVQTPEEAGVKLIIQPGERA